MKQEIKLTRKYFQRVVEETKEKGIGNVIVYDLSRTFRDLIMLARIGFATLDKNMARNDYEKVAFKHGKDWWSTQTDRYQTYLWKDTSKD